MKQSWMVRLPMLALGMVLLLGVNAVQAQEGGDDAATQAELKKVQADLDEVKRDLKGIKADLQRIILGMRALQQPQKKPQQRPQDTTVYKIDIGDSPIRGPKDAKATIVEYVDFQCPYCTREFPTIDKILKAYPNDVRWVFKHYPLGFHKQAKPAHAAAALAQKQKGNDGFWQMHDLIIKGGTKKLDIPTLRSYAEQLNMDLTEFDAVMKDESLINSFLSKDMTDARKYNVRGTPTIFINGLKLSPRGEGNYKKRIDEILKGGDQKQGK